MYNLGSIFVDQQDSLYPTNYGQYQADLPNLGVTPLYMHVGGWFGRRPPPPPVTVAPVTRPPIKESPFYRYG